MPEVEDWIVPIGKAKVRREGTDVTITAHSRMVGFALQAAEKLAEEGIEAEVIDLRTLRPLDHETIVESVKKTNRLVSVEEGWGPMGVGAEVVARVIEHAFDYLDAPPLRVHQEDVPLPYAANLEALSLPGGRQDRRGRESGDGVTHRYALPEPDGIETSAQDGSVLELTRVWIGSKDRRSCADRPMRIPGPWEKCWPSCAGISPTPTNSRAA